MLGVETSTLDDSGEITARHDMPGITLQQVRDVLLGGAGDDFFIWENDGPDVIRGDEGYHTPATDKTDIDEGKAIALMLANPSMIKRPVVEGGTALLVGFKESEWEPVLSQ